MHKAKVFVSGNFNVLHPGHIRLLTYASSLGGELIVALNPSDSKNAYVPEGDRLAGVKALSIVDKCFVMTGSLFEELEKIKPNFIIKGSEHSTDINPEREFIDKYGGELVFSSGESWESYSTFSEVNISNQRRITHDYAYLKRHAILPSKLRSIVDNFKKLKVVVLGDIVVDEYIEVEPVGMSREDISIVTTPTHSNKFLGGAGIVALQAQILGAQVDFYSMTGSDDLNYFCRQILDDNDVNYSIYEDPSRPTTYKLRYQCQNKTLFRLSKIRQHPIDPIVLEGIIDKVKERLLDCDILIYSDFSYGFLTPEIISSVTDLCVSNKIFVVADSQSSSQSGNIGRFRNCDLITPTEFEGRQALENYSDGLVTIASQLIDKFATKNVLLTLGREGVLIQKPNNSSSPFITDKIKALNNNPVNVSGAGDTMLVCSSLALAVGATIWEAAYIGSIGSGIKISTSGNSPIGISEIIEELSIQ